LQKIPPHNYQIAPLSVEMDAFDFYIVDGSLIVSCACAAMLHAMKHGGNMSMVMVAIHDHQRKIYHQFQEVAEVVHTGRSKLLSVHRLKQNVTEDDIFKLREKNIWEKM